MTADRDTLAADLLAHIRAFRALRAQAAVEEQAIRAAWAALQAWDTEQAAAQMQERS